MKVAGASADEVVPCDDFLQFSKVLNNLRRSDDRVRHELNTLLPTSSFQSNTDYEKTCKGFVLQMLEDHKRREGTIRHCLTVSAARLAELQRMQAPDDEQSRRKFLRSVKKQHLLLRQFQTELSEEEVIQTSAMKVIYERCRSHYHHPAFERFK
ncbi:Coiled-coil domain-containing protein 58 [Clonorchis sinensis]|uniref:Protein MIX23 n=1 Tax=Clonorchis sinensis TaxID=79923 RepID=A0A8T1N0F5_CLOSI|nr:Coiled-coil domain-containing protein 58 [Clonorchis sinensis]